MHARDLVELAALLAVNGSTLIEHARHLSPEGLEQYWTAAKCRHERWLRTLKLFSLEVQYVDVLETMDYWTAIRPVLEEILTSEILARVWAAICCGYDRRHGLEEGSLVARTVLASHLEARHRTLNLMVYGRGLRVEQAVSLNRMRRRNERWADVFLSLLASHVDISEFVFSAGRAREFARELKRTAEPDLSVALLLASLRLSYQREQPSAAANPDLNRRVAESLLATLPPHLFDSTGQLKSLWLLRMQSAACDTQGLIDQLLALDDAPSKPAESWITSSSRLPRSGPL